MPAAGLDLLQVLPDIVDTRMRLVVHCAALIIDYLALHLDLGRLHNGRVK